MPIIIALIRLSLSLGYVIFIGQENLEIILGCRFVVRRRGLLLSLISYLILIGVDRKLVLRVKLLLKDILLPFFWRLWLIHLKGFL
jgi:hypothetical protein